uniref:AT1G17665-like protein n=1 Tax=Geranium incanum TaxID=1158081 RepID=A0A0G4AP18_9ROSI|nr:AT1G17665-like protein [Geranium incanum]
MWFSLIFFISSFSLISFSFSLYNKRRLHRTDQNQVTTKPDPSVVLGSKFVDETHSLLLEILPSDSPEWPGLYSDGNVDSCESDRRGKKKKKKRAKKKSEDGSGLELGPRVKPELVCLYPFTSSSSATQRKIKQQYDQLVKCHEAKGLTLAQVAQFATCLIEARNELKHKSEVIQRKFTITKALFLKADRSSIDRLRQQIYKLELEEKRLEEDTFVYNWLQQQLKISPAYKKMLEICACMELKAKSGELMENQDAEVAEISFEELLAQEKKDSFWQKNGKLRSLSS